MVTLKVVLDAIREGVRLLRMQVKHIKAEVETDIFGPLTKEEVDHFLALRAQLVPEASNYSTSIVDLLKVLGLDSSLTARRDLAEDLGYNGDTADTGPMNVWLHDKVMQQVAEREFQ